MRSDGGFDLQCLLQQLQNGNGKEVDRLLPVLSADLRRIVRGVMASEGQNHALRPTAVVDEAFLGFVQSRRGLTSSDATVESAWRNRAFFLAVAARQMRLVLGDYVRRRSTIKAGLRVTLAMNTETVHEFTAVDRFLNSLAAMDAAGARALELTLFGGMNDRELALVLHTSIAEARRDLARSQSWLAEKLSIA